MASYTDGKAAVLGVRWEESKGGSRRVDVQSVSEQARTCLVAHIGRHRVPANAS